MRTWWMSAFADERRVSLSASSSLAPSMCASALSRIMSRANTSGVADSTELCAHVFHGSSTLVYLVSFPHVAHGVSNGASSVSSDVHPLYMTG